MTTGHRAAPPLRATMKAQAESLGTISDARSDFFNNNPSACGKSIFLSGLHEP